MPGDFTVHKRVRFQGKEYWWHEDVIAPLDHYDGAGNLLADPFRDLSFAIITEGGEIKRYREVIGSTEDLELV